MSKTIARDAVFALEFAPDTPPLVSKVVAVAWTSDALAALKQIRDEAISRAKEKDAEAFRYLPYATLRAHLHMELAAWASIKDDIGLRSPYVPYKGDTEVWGHLVSDDPRGDVQKIRDAFARWCEGPLAHYCDAHGANAHGVSRLRDLNTQDKVVRVRPARVQLFPWGAAPQAGEPSPFDVTAGVLARHLAGQELFPGLGPVVQVMGGPENNCAEVLTRPANAAGGWFSLVCELSAETLPGAAKPIIFCSFKRRRWANSLSTGYTRSRSIGGFVFPHAKRPRHAFRFSVMRSAKQWKTDQSYPQFEFTFDLERGYEDERVVGYPSDDQASVVVMTKAEVADHANSTLLAGVALVDQADAFARICSALQGMGLRPFTDFGAVSAVNVDAPNLSMLKAEVTLARLLDRHLLDADADDGVSVEDAMAKATDAPAERWFKGKVPSPDPKHDKVVAAIRALTSDTAFAKDATRQTVYLVSQSPDDIAWIKTTANAMLGDSIKVLSVALPANTHGPVTALPNSTDKTKQRFEARVRAWLDFAQKVGLPDRAMVLIQAPRFYKEEGSKTQHDDWVNKPAARKALASKGCTVQYLLPSDPGRLDKFLPRVQAALLDIVFGHAGSVWGLKQACAACFGAASPAPRCAVGIGSIMVYPEFEDRPRSVFVATRLDCDTGEAWVRFAHLLADPVQSDWMRFDAGAKYLVDSRIELPSSNLDKRELLARFFESTFEDIAARDPNAVVFIDSTRNARLASWLSDKGVGDARRQISPGVVASQRWPNLRLLRIREQAPAIAQEKVCEILAPDGSTVRTWTSTPRLFEVRGTAAPTFWSLARPTSHHKRGASCYRQMLLPNPRKTEANPGDYVLYPSLHDKQHLTPRAVEIVVLQKQAGDNDVQLASFAQHLRAGVLTARNERWVTTPSPLRIIDKLAEYLKV